MAKAPSYGRDNFGNADRPIGASHERRASAQKPSETLAESAVGAAESAKTAATDQIEQQKAAASQSLDVFAQAVRKASEELSNRDQTAAAQLIQEAASGLENLSRSLSNQSLSDMVGTVREFGRRNPAALAGGAALVGLALGRFARSSSQGSDAAQGSSGRSDWQTASPSSDARRSGTDTAGEFSASRASVASAAPSSPQTRQGSLPQAGGAKRSGGSQ
jgi:hypothetical protein